jgi:tetratricopeptide (TPR) repeat protein
MQQIFKPIKWLIVFACLFCFLPAGCASRNAAVPVSVNNTDESDQPLTRYYYFAEAQLALAREDLNRAEEYMEKAWESDPQSVYLMKELLSIYLKQRENEKAFHMAAKILEKQPGDLQILTLYGRVSHALDRVPEAVDAYEKILEKDPSQENIYLLLANLYLKEEDPERAIEILNKMLAKFPDSYAGHFFLGKAFLEIQEFDNAEKEFKMALELDPNLEEPRFELIELYKSRGQHEKIIAQYQEIISRDPENIRAAIELGYYYHSQGKTTQSREIFGNLGKRSDTDMDVLRILVSFYLDEEQYEKTMVIIDGMLSGSPESSDLHYLAGVVNDELANSGKALEHFKNVSPESRFYKNAVIHVAFLYQKMDEIDKAVDHLKTVIEKTPEDPDIYHYLGVLYEESENYPEAEIVLKEGLEIDPDNPKIHFRLGVVYDKLDRKEDCIDQMKIVIELDPENANALNYIGYTLAELDRDLDEAEELIKRAIELKPDDGYITDSLGWVFYRQGRYEEAVEVLEKAVALVSDDPIILEHMGDAYLKVSQKDKALEFYEKSLEVKEEKDKADLEKKIQDLRNEMIKKDIKKEN